jgi:hypothetical protein
VKAFREIGETQAALQMALEMVALRREAEKKAANVADATTAANVHMTAEVEAVKADLAYHIAFVQVMSLTGKQ